MRLDQCLALHGLTADNLAEAERAGSWFGFPGGRALLQLRPTAALELELLVWLVISSGPPGTYKRYVNDLKRIGLDLGARRIVFYSKRRGWQRVAREWQRQGDRFSLEL